MSSKDGRKIERYRCDNCNWIGTKLGKTLEETPDLWERLDPGGEVPAGECPKCGALAYTVKARAAGDKQILQECLDATRIHLKALRSLEDVAQGMAITAAKLEELSR